MYFGILQQRLSGESNISFNTFTLKRKSEKVENFPIGTLQTTF